VVGTERLVPRSGYFRAKLLQEELIGAGYSLHHRQGHPVLRIPHHHRSSAAVGDVVRLPEALIQPMASVDVAEAAAIAAGHDPAAGIVEVGGPKTFRLPDLIRIALTARGDVRQVISDPKAQYWGVDIGEHTLIPGSGASLFDTTFEDWLLETAARS
jgi:uncharacterized protein YbjT (DUF2867 family)